MTILSFNPILVWFYPSTLCELPLSKDSFQSHFGLILSIRLLLMMSSCTSTFQSHFGLILSMWKTPHLNKLLLAFNPILVWFYRVYARKRPKDCKSFQSHFGLILSLRTCKRWLLYNHLSIPFWSDFILFFHSFSKSFWYLSIPFWSDFILT